MADEVRLLVRADDAGSTLSANMGCFRAAAEGIVQSVEVMMPCAWVEHAAALFNPRPDIDIGIHLTLTSEWTNLRWRPLTQAPSLVDQTGSFYPSFAPVNYPNAVGLNQVDWSVSEAVAELSAQIDLGLKTFRNVTHISSHMIADFAELDVDLGGAIAEICAARGLVHQPFGPDLTWIKGYPKRPYDPAKRTEALLAELKTLKPGTYLFLDHPGVASDEARATGNPSYDDVAIDRESCLNVMTDPNLARDIEALGIKLISYADLRK